MFLEYLIAFLDSEYLASLQYSELMNRLLVNDGSVIDVLQKTENQQLSVFFGVSMTFVPEI